MRELLVDGSRVNGRVFRVSFDPADSTGRVAVAEVLLDAAFFNPNANGGFLYKSRNGNWIAGNALRADALAPVAALDSNLQYEYGALSPNGQSIVWSARKSAISMLVITGANKVNTRTIRRGPGIIRVPAWSPQSDAIAYYSGDDKVLQTDEFTLRLIQADGTGDRQIALPSKPTGMTADRTQPPRWSPNGSRLLFAGNYEDDDLIRAYAYVVQGDGTGIKRMDGGTWSGDGRLLLGVKRTSLPFGPFVLAATEASSGRIAQFDLGFELPPSVSNGRWSSDGKLYAFTTNDGQLMLIDVERRKMSRLTSAAEGAKLSWIEPG